MHNAADQLREDERAFNTLIELKHQLINTLTLVEMSLRTHDSKMHKSRQSDEKYLLVWVLKVEVPEWANKLITIYIQDNSYNSSIIGKRDK